MRDNEVQVNSIKVLTRGAKRKGQHVEPGLKIKQEVK